MRTFLLVAAAVIYLYSPYGPSWGQTAVNFAIVLIIFSVLGKNQGRRRHY